VLQLESRSLLAGYSVMPPLLTLQVMPPVAVIHQEQLLAVAGQVHPVLGWQLGVPLLALGWSAAGDSPQKAGIVQLLAQEEHQSVEAEIAAPVEDVPSPYL
jgi:hypothetical protein